MAGKSRVFVVEMGSQDNGWEVGGMLGGDAAWWGCHLSVCSHRVTDIIHNTGER